MYDYCNVLPRFGGAATDVMWVSRILDAFPVNRPDPKLPEQDNYETVFHFKHPCFPGTLTLFFADSFASSLCLF